MPCPDPVPPPSMAGRGPEWVDPGGEESDSAAGRPTPITMRGDDAEPAEPSAPGPSASPARVGERGASGSAVGYGILVQTAPPENLTALSVGAIVIVAGPVTMSLVMIALPSPEVFDKRAQ